MIYKQEVDQLKDEYFFKDCNQKELEQRRKLYFIFEKLLIYMGLVEKHIDIQPSGSKVKALHWCFTRTDALSKDTQN